MLKTKIKRIHKDAIVPYKAHEDDAGFDVCSVEERMIKAGETGIVSTGIQIELPPQTEAQIRPRSGLALKHSLTVLNSPGTIDAGYRGELKIIMINHGKEDFTVTKGMRIAQMVIAPVLEVAFEEVEDLSASSRDIGGFGSSGV
ncbi:MAG TPA: dUTP diphosphatase [Bacillota bacterium]|nr:dUTP diphosphatase [Bacillota bacterium]